MRNLLELNEYRSYKPVVKYWFGFFGDETCGSFNVPSCIDKANLHVIAVSGRGWDHISVSRKNRCPNWPEMDQIKRLFFKPDEIVIQFHVGEKQHISIHPYTLHLWKSWTQIYELPPPEFI